jgi:hypothetical protein
MLITHTKMEEQLNLMMDRDEMTHVRFMGATFSDDAGRKHGASWHHVQYPDTGADLYMVRSVVNGRETIKQWYSPGGRDESLELYRESVLVHEENTLGDNAHPN